MMLIAPARAVLLPSVFGARTGYLRAVILHAHLELVAMVLLLVEGARARGQTEGAPT